jgi:hypothetical protein
MKRACQRSAAPLVLRRVTISEEQGELKCFDESDDLDLRSGGERFGDIPTIERPAETVISRALRGHERMFAQPRTVKKKRQISQRW